MNPAVIVMHEVQSNHRRMIRGLLTEGVCESRKPPHRQSRRRHRRGAVPKIRGRLEPDRSRKPAISGMATLGCRRCVEKEGHGGTVESFRSA